MLFNELKKMLSHFGFQGDDLIEFDIFLQQADNQKNFFVLTENSIEWWIPDSDEKQVLDEYNKKPYLSLPCVPLEPQSGYAVQKFDISIEDYGHLITLVSFLKQGCSDGFFIDGQGFWYSDSLKAALKRQAKGDALTDDELGDLEKSLQGEPDNALLLNALGIGYAQKSNLQYAAKYFVDAFEKEPHYAEPFSNMGALLWGAGETQKAFNLFCEALLRNPFDVSIQDNFIESGLKLMSYEKMDLVLSKVFELYPDYEGLLYLKANLEFRLGNHEESKKTLKAFLEKCPDNRDAQQFLADLESETHESV